MKKLPNSRGSILIWTMLLGLSLATVFFFFSQRLNANASSQRETMEYLNSKIFLESYVDYIQGLNLNDLNSLKAPDGTISFDSGTITGTLTNEVDVIVGSVDALGESANYNFADDVKIEWNLCADNNKSDLTVGDVNAYPPYAHVNNPCTPDGYDDMKASLGVDDPFKIKSTGAPFQYSITSNTATPLLDNKWQLDIEISLGFRKKLTANRIFTPQP